VRTTIWPAFAGTSEPLRWRLPKGIAKLRNSLTISTTRWDFSTLSSMETFLADRKAMTQHQQTMPMLRTTLMWSTDHKGEWTIWEVVDRLPPSTAHELSRDSSPGEPRATSKESEPTAPQSRQQCCLPGLVIEVSADGQDIIAWPGPDTVDET